MLWILGVLAAIFAFSVLVSSFLYDEPEFLVLVVILGLVSWGLFAGAGAVYNNVTVSEEFEKTETKTIQLVSLTDSSQLSYNESSGPYYVYAYPGYYSMYYKEDGKLLERQFKSEQGIIEDVESEPSIIESTTSAPYKSNMNSGLQKFLSFRGLLDQDGVSYKVVVPPGSILHK